MDEKVVDSNHGLVHNLSLPLQKAEGSNKLKFTWESFPLFRSSGNLPKSAGYKFVKFTAWVNKSRHPSCQLFCACSQNTTQLTPFCSKETNI